MKKIENIGENVENLELTHNAGGSVNGSIHFENVFASVYLS